MAPLDPYPSIHPSCAWYFSTSVLPRSNVWLVGCIFSPDETSSLPKLHNGIPLRRSSRLVMLSFLAFLGKRHHLSGRPLVHHLHPHTSFVSSFRNRSFGDLTQYPVFPWVISNYHSININLDDPMVYRDLSKPMGAIGKERALQIKERFGETDADGSNKY